MKKWTNLFWMMLSLLLIGQPMGAQEQEQEEDRNAIFKVSVGEFSYTPKQKKESVG